MIVLPQKLKVYNKITMLHLAGQWKIMVYKRMYYILYYHWRLWFIKK